MPLIFIGKWNGTVFAFFFHQEEVCPDFGGEKLYSTTFGEKNPSSVDANPKAPSTEWSGICPESTLVAGEEAPM
jgi:hypothetical protein